MDAIISFYYCLKESSWKINAITTLIAEWITAFTLQLLMHGLSTV